MKMVETPPHTKLSVASVINTSVSDCSFFEVNRLPTWCGVLYFIVSKMMSGCKGDGNKQLCGETAVLPLLRM